MEVNITDDGRTLRVQVRDDGRGLPPGFEIDKTTSLGLSIVRDLVRSQLAGTISMGPAPRGASSGDGASTGREKGTLVRIEVPLREP